MLLNLLLYRIFKAHAYNKKNNKFLEKKRYNLIFLRRLCVKIHWSENKKQIILSKNLLFCLKKKYLFFTQKNKYFFFKQNNNIKFKILVVKNFYKFNKKLVPSIEQIIFNNKLNIFKKVRFLKYYYTRYKSINLIYNKKKLKKRYYKFYYDTTFFIADRKRLFLHVHKYEKYIYYRKPYRMQIYTISYLNHNYINFKKLYKNQIREQHLVRWLYKITYAQLVKIFQKGVKYSKKHFEYLFFKYLEYRADICLYRINIVFSNKQAKQWVNRSLFMVNDKIINWHKYQINIGDIIIPVKELRLQIVPSKYYSIDYGYIYNSIRLFWRPIQRNQYPTYFIINERIPAALIWRNPSTSKIYCIRPWSIQYITLSLLNYS